MIIFTLFKQQTMKKILLLLAASLVLFTGCQKEDPEEGANGLGPATQEYPCSKCGAKYSVTCKGPEIKGIPIPASGDDWKLITNPSWGEWTVTDESGQNVPRYEYWNYKKMYFICTCGEKSKVFNIDEFKTQISKP